MKSRSLGAIAGGGAMMATGVGAPIGGALLGAGIGGAKDQFMDRPAALEAASKANIANIYSPWTGRKQEMPAMPSMGNGIFQGGTTGLLMGLSNSGDKEDTGLGNKGEKTLENPYTSMFKTNLRGRVKDGF